MKPLFHEDGSEVGPNERWPVRTPKLETPNQWKGYTDLYWRSVARSYTFHPPKRLIKVVSRIRDLMTQGSRGLEVMDSNRPAIVRELMKLPQGLRHMACIRLGLNEDGTRWDPR